MSVFKSGVAGILIYLAIDGAAEWLEKRQEERIKNKFIIAPTT